jgi:WXG100 family type VII secretion target
MTSFAIDLELLAALVERMTACGNRLVEVQDDVDARMKRVHATWSGTAAAQHAQAHERWVAGARQMHEALTVLRSIASTAEENYGAAIRANVQMWSR